MRPIFWIGILILALLGALSGVTRTIVVTRTLLGAPAAELSPEDQNALGMLSSMMNMPEGTRRYRLAEQDMREAATNYNSKPFAMLLHAAPGTVFLLLAPFQLVARLRRRWPALHRSTGYLLLVMAVPFGITGFYIAVVDPVFSPWASAAAILGALLFGYAGVRAYAAIRRGDVVQHRAWMLRFLAVAYGIAVIRALSFPFFALFDVTFKELGPPTFWIGWLTSLMLAEWWIRRSQPPLPIAFRGDGRAA